MSFQVSGLTKSYLGRTVLDEVSFHLDSGSITGLLGLNGAGKTTLLECLGTLVPFEHGTITCDGTNLSTSLQDYQRLIGFQPEQPCLQSVLTVKEQLRIFAILREVEQPEKRIDELLEIHELKALADAPARELSKGEAQRVSFAIASVHRPRLLLLDEPTSGLDPKQLAHFRSVLLREKEQRMVLLSTHHLNEVEHLCDTVLVLHNNKVDQMMSNERIERYFIQAVGSDSSIGVVNE